MQIGIMKKGREMMNIHHKKRKVLLGLKLKIAAVYRRTER